MPCSRPSPTHLRTTGPSPLPDSEGTRRVPARRAIDATRARASASPSSHQVCRGSGPARRFATPPTTGMSEHTVPAARHSRRAAGCARTRTEPLSFRLRRALHEFRSPRSPSHDNAPGAHGVGDANARGDADDIHVLAAAIEGAADVIVTRNLRDFPAQRLAPHGLTAQHPDLFIADLFNAESEAVLAAVRRHRAALRNPPRTANRERTLGHTRTPWPAPNGVAHSTAPGLHLIGTATIVHEELALLQD